MDFKTLLNEDSVEPTRRFSSSHDGGSVRNDSISGRAESMPGRKRSRSPSEAAMAHPEPSPKRIKAKRQRQEPPMWARKWTQQWQQQHGGKSNGYVVKQHLTFSPSSIPTPAPIPASRPAPSAQRIPVRPSTAASTATNPPQSIHSGARPEPSYTNMEPMDELCKEVMDFIYQNTILNRLIFDSGPDTEVEIEAKIGNIIDRERDGRIARIPVRNECVLSEHHLHHLNLPIAFKSSMTDLQHQSMNNQLNKAVQESMLKDADRQKIKYVHLRERDKFYVCPNQYFRELPPLIREKATGPHKKLPRIRLTFDQKTGELKASIVKIRWADMHVYSPRTLFDWRISISLEMKYLGDVSNLEPVQEAGRAVDGRQKDRLSYEHQGIKIDLTQVTTENRKEHELEFELPAGILKEEAQKHVSKQENDLQGLVQNFINDIRVATRAFPH